MTKESETPKPRWKLVNRRVTSGRISLLGSLVFATALGIGTLRMNNSTAAQEITCDPTHHLTYINNSLVLASECDGGEIWDIDDLTAKQQHAPKDLHDITDKLDSNYFNLPVDKFEKDSVSGRRKTSDEKNLEILQGDDPRVAVLRQAMNLELSQSLGFDVELKWDRARPLYIEDQQTSNIARQLTRDNLGWFGVSDQYLDSGNIEWDEDGNLVAIYETQTTQREDLLVVEPAAEGRISLLDGEDVITDWGVRSKNLPVSIFIVPTTDEGIFGLVILDGSCGNKITVLPVPFKEFKIAVVPTSVPPTPTETMLVLVPVETPIPTVTPGETPTETSTSTKTSTGTPTKTSTPTRTATPRIIYISGGGGGSGFFSISVLVTATPTTKEATITPQPTPAESTIIPGGVTPAKEATLTAQPTPKPTTTGTPTREPTAKPA